MKKNVLLTIAVLFCFSLSAQKYVKPSVKQASRSFAIITDTKTWKHCKAELTAYQQVLAEEQLPAFIVYKDWKRPEEVKAVISRLYDKNHLEGVVFVGNIPIAMIRKAQHLCVCYRFVLSGLIPAGRLLFEICSWWNRTYVCGRRILLQSALEGYTPAQQIQERA